MSTIVFVGILWCLIGFFYVVFKERPQPVVKEEDLQILTTVVSHCRTLDINPEVLPSLKAKDLKKIYWQKASMHHPDKGGTSKRFDEIKQAYDFIKIFVSD